jgi:valyl-tRNA synthetase
MKNIIEFVKKYKVHILITLLLIISIRSCSKSSQIRKLNKSTTEQITINDSLQKIVNKQKNTIENFSEVIRQEKIKVQGLYITIALLLAFVVIDIYVSLSNFSDYERNTNELSVKINTLYLENERLSKELAEYEVTEQYLQNLGATPDQAQKIIKASEVHNVSPKSSGS